MRQRVTEPGQPRPNSEEKKREEGLRTSRKPEARPLTLPRMALGARSLAHALQSRSCTVYGAICSTRIVLWSFSTGSEKATGDAHLWTEAFTLLLLRSRQARFSGDNGKGVEVPPGDHGTAAGALCADPW